MCSRKGTPMSKWAWPVPSRLISTLIWVSEVLRSTLALRSIMAILQQYVIQGPALYVLAMARGYRKPGLATGSRHFPGGGVVLLQFLLRQGPVLRVGIQALLVQLGRVVAQIDQYREVIRADVRQAPDAGQGEMAAVEDMVQRPAQEPVVGMEGVEHAPADTGVEKTADLAEQAGGGGPGDIVQIAGDDDRRMAVLDAPCHQQQLHIALGGFVILRRAWWCRVQEVHLNRVAAGQLDQGMDGRHVLLYQPGDFSVMQRQTGIHVHAVEVFQRTGDPVRIVT